MGNMVALTFLTDHFAELKKDPKGFVNLINDRMSRPLSDPEKDHPHYVTVHQFEHSKDLQVIWCRGGNSYPVGPLATNIEHNSDWMARRFGIHGPDAKARKGWVIGYLRNIVADLRSTADMLEEAIKKWESDADASSQE